MNHSVTVLLSTYNGEQYLQEQLDSILNQEDVIPRILVRDDGSTDGTIEILNSYQDNGLLTWYGGSNLGPAKSFMTLLRDADDDEYFAFSDQDDFWNTKKLKIAIESIKDFVDYPALYFGQPQLVDQDLNNIQTIGINPLLTMGEALVYEFCPGCTVVMNKTLRNILNTYTPSYVPMHDVWTYSVARAIGAKIVFSNKVPILYRQHEQNAIGMTNSAVHEWKRRIKRLTNKEHSRWRRAVEIKKGFYNLMPSENKEILNIFIDGKEKFSNRIKLLSNNQYRCSDKGTWYRFKIAVLMNTY